MFNRVRMFISGLGLFGRRAPAIAPALAATLAASVANPPTVLSMPGSGRSRYHRSRSGCNGAFGHRKHNGIKWRRDPASPFANRCRWR